MRVRMGERIVRRDSRVVDCDSLETCQDLALYGNLDTGYWILDTTLALMVYLDSLEPGLDSEVKLRADPDEPQ